jgi:probable HAF family extracellular repeat protein
LLFSEGKSTIALAPFDLTFRANIVAKRLHSQKRRSVMPDRYVIVLAAGVLLSVAERSDGTQQYCVTDLGPVPAGQYYYYAINARGEVAGVTTVGGQNHAVLYSHGTMTDLGTLGGLSSSAYGINDAAQVVGSAATKGPISGTSGATHAFLYSSGTMADLGLLGGYSISVATDINDSGQVVGYCTATSSEQAFLYSGGTMTALGALGGQGSAAYGINASGQVAGGAGTSTGYSHAFLYSNGQMADLGTLPGYPDSYATSINAGGTVVGESYSYNNGATYYHGFLYSNGTMVDIGWLPGEEGMTFVSGINSSGEVIGQSGARAFLYSSGTMTDLDTLINAASGWILFGADGINDSGQIVGFGQNPAGKDDVFVLTPLAPGDANGDGRVDINDLTIVLTNFGKSGMTWSQGDFIGDGTVDINDLTIVLANFGKTYAASAAPMAAVPEPPSLLLIGLGVVSLVSCARWRRR